MTATFTLATHAPLSTVATNASWSAEVGFGRRHHLREDDVARLAASIELAARRWSALEATAWPMALERVRAMLLRRRRLEAHGDGSRGGPSRRGAWRGGTSGARASGSLGWVSDDPRVDALAAAHAAATRELGRTPHATQLAAAAAMLDGCLVEMATGEGKSLAVALASVVAALGGERVHVLTANDYLAARDAAGHRPLFDACGVVVGAVVGADDEARRRRAYAADVTYATVREVAFDTLRDRLEQPDAGDLERRASRLVAGGDAVVEPRVPARALAIVDEADSVLIDEAAMPLVLAERHDDPQQRATAFQAITLARVLAPAVDAVVDASARRVQLTASGEARLAELAEPLGGAWLHRRHRHAWVEQALHALHLLARDRDYVVRDGAVELVDAVTGRRDSNRAWSRGLHALVALKEGCRPVASSRTRARTSVATFVAGYARLAGTSGSLREVRGALAAEHRCRVVTLAPRVPSRRVDGPELLFRDAASRRSALAARVAALHAQGRPVLVGMASVAESDALGAALASHGLVARVLHASCDADEAAIVARAGAVGAITVATRMAGRGTDITLGQGAAALGGLHVINAQDNRSARLDRQLAGRCARQGDPGSVEIWRTPHTWTASGAAGFVHRWPTRAPRVPVPPWMLRAAVALTQRAEERRAARERRRWMLENERWDS